MSFQQQKKKLRSEQNSRPGIHMERFGSVFTDDLCFVFGALINIYKNKPINFVMSVCPHVTTRKKRKYIYYLV